VEEKELGKSRGKGKTGETTFIRGNRRDKIRKEG